MHSPPPETGLGLHEGCPVYCPGLATVYLDPLDNPRRYALRWRSYGLSLQSGWPRNLSILLSLSY